MSYIGNSPGVASQRVTTTLTATAGQTVFTTQSGYVLGYVDVYLNGAKLVNGADFEAITGTYITLFSGASAGDVVELVSYVPRGLSDGYTKAEADAKFLDVGGDTATGSLALAAASLTGNLTLSGGTANGIGYLNGSKVLTTGSNFTYDGSTISVGSSGVVSSYLMSSSASNQTNQIVSFYNNGSSYGNLAIDGSNLYFKTSGTVGATLTASSLYTASGINVGIGTSSPSGKLHVSQTSGSMYINVAGGIPRMYLGGGNGWGFNRITASEDIFFGEPGDTGTWRVRGAGTISLGVGSTNTTMTIQGDGGNVSIGSTASRQKLHVKGRFNSDLNDDFYGLWGEGNTAANGYSFLGIGDWYSSSLYIQKQTGSSFAHIYTYNSSHHVLLQGGSGDNGTTSASGNVYIGTTTNTNSSKLVVNGTISQTVGGTQYLVVDQSDIGTALNQIPLNQYLGSMAFQDRESISFSGGTGTLSSLDITAISQQLNVSANDVFVYDTSKDSDGGAWRKRCQHTSWYNEQLNTPTRGSRREFPAVAVVICTTNTMTIHDGDDPDLPMWMVFSPGGILDWPTSTHTRLIANALNGGIVVVSEDGGQWFRFIDDTTHIIYSSLTYNVYSDRSIVSRNKATAYTGTGGAVNTYAVLHWDYNDVAMTVLPNAPIDPLTKLPTPTIAIATRLGVSIITDLGTVFNLTPESEAAYASVKTFYSVAFTKDYGIILSDRQTAYGYSNVVYLPYYKYNQSLSDTYSKLTGSFSYEWDGIVRNNLNGPGTAVGYWTVPDNAKHVYDVCSTASDIALGSTTELTLLEPFGKGLVATIKSNFNTGWMPGLVKGAWLADNTQETIVSSNLISNGTFDSNVTGWTAVGSGASVSWNAAGRINVVTGTEQWAGAYTTVQVIAGKTYIITGDIVSNGGGWAGISGSYEGGSSGVKAFNGAYPAAQPWTFYHTATQTGTLYITIDHSNTTDNITIVADNINCRIADLDRSYNNQGLQVYGTITKTPVAPGADLMAYSGWLNGPNIASLSQPAGGTVSVGTADIAFVLWFKQSTASNIYEQIIQYGASEQNIFRVYITPSRDGFLLQATNTSFAGGYDSWSVAAHITGEWQMFVATKSGTTLKYYLDGRHIGSYTLGYFSSFSGSPFYIGGVPGGGASYMSTAFSLYRVTGTIPSPEQITKMYNDEKHLFKENAKATLYGTSNSVNALSYDEDTQLLHVGTSSGRSVFDGLRRVENTTTAVTAAISAANGLVVEN